MVSKKSQKKSQSKAKAAKYKTTAHFLRTTKHPCVLRIKKYKKHIIYNKIKNIVVEDKRKDKHNFHFLVFLKKKLQLFCLMIKNKIARINKLLGILIFPLSGFLFFVIKPFFNSEQYYNVSILFALFSVSLLFLCLFSGNSLGLLSSFFRSGLNYKIVQFVFSMCVKIYIFVKAPYLVTRMLLFCFLSLYFFLLFECISKSYILFLTLSKALFTVGIIYTRLRMSYFNPNDLGLKAYQIITFEQAFPLLDRALANDISHSVNNKKDAFLFSKLSKRTNHFVLPFLIQKRGLAMATGTAASIFAQAMRQVLTNNPEVVYQTSVVAVNWLLVGLDVCCMKIIEPGAK